MTLMPYLERQEKPETLQAVLDAIEPAASLDELLKLLSPAGDGQSQQP